MRQPSLRPDKQGRMVDIDVRPNGWKLTPRERDAVYQAFLVQFPDRDCTSGRAWAWMKLEAESRSISTSRIRAFVGEAIAAERGDLDRSWAWWVGCSLSDGDSGDQRGV